MLDIVFKIYILVSYNIKRKRMSLCTDYTGNHYITISCYAFVYMCKKAFWIVFRKVLAFLSSL